MAEWMQSVYMYVSVYLYVYMHLYIENWMGRDEECLGVWMMYGMWIDRWIKAGGVNADFVLLVS